MKTQPTPKQRPELDKHIDHYGRCCAQNASWSTSNRTPSQEAREEWSTDKARQALLDAIILHTAAGSTNTQIHSHITLPPLPDVRGGGYSACQLEDMLVAYAKSAIEFDRQRSEGKTHREFKDMGANI